MSQLLAFLPTKEEKKGKPPLIMSYLISITSRFYHLKGERQLVLGHDNSVRPNPDPGTCVLVPKTLRLKHVAVVNKGTRETLQGLQSLQGLLCPMASSAVPPRSKNFRVNASAL